MSFLYEKIAIAKTFGLPIPEIPQTIVDNLASNIKLRDYQDDAFSDTLLYLATKSLSENKQTHLLYHMATGSGKTVIMAMLILHYYTLGYRNFLFFTNQTSIVNKTKINFLPNKSNKHLFADSVVINGKNVSIREVTNFQSSDEDSINICFDTVQGIHSELFFAKENSLTINDFETEKVVLLADEAHHLNTLTKSDKSDEDDERTWESTIDQIFLANKDNVLFEFTATCDLKDPKVLSKYEDKIVFNFDLKEFRKAGYTKEFNNFSSNTSPWTRTLQALIMSEYRKLVFEKHHIFSKPIVMLKSYRIADSKAFYDEFYSRLKSLAVSEIQAIQSANSGLADATFINQAFAFFSANNISFSSLIEMMKIDFSEEHSLQMNGEASDDDTLYKKANTLDDRDNPYRLIFTVAKLNEGWDVLSLYDIVRLYETRQTGKHNKPSDFTLSEAQLIGRGARYFPFVFQDGQIPDRKKYTNDIDNPEAICETLLYHCVNDSRYISELRAALVATGLVPEEPVRVTYHLKKSFQNSDVYKDGFVFANERIVKSREGVTCLPDRIRTQVFSYRCSSGRVSVGRLFEKESNNGRLVQMAPVKLKDIELNVSGKAYRCFHSTLSFEILHEKFPHLKSQIEFITSSDYLGDISIIFTSPSSGVPSYEDKLNACKLVFEEISKFIQTIKVSYEGTEEFKAYPIKDKIPQEKTRELAEDRVDGEAYGEGVSQNDFRVPEQYRLDLASKNWYAFDDNKGTSEEKKFIAYFNTIVQDLEKKYDDVYVIRNELFVSLYSFKTGDRFEPDYILILKKNGDDMNDYLCVFVEPKGAHLLEKDKWKGEFMLEMEKRAKPVVKFVDDNHYCIWGTPLYNEAQTKGDFISYVFGKKIF
jgi:type III restriction enzyme